jgi:hypothetical protein
MLPPNARPPWAGPEMLPPWAGPEMISPNMMPPWTGPEMLPPHAMPPDYLYEDSPSRWRRPPGRTRRKKKRHHRECCDSTSSSCSCRDSGHDGPYDDLPYQDCQCDSGTQENATPLTYSASQSIPALPAQEVWPNWEQGHDESSSS